jgi:prepilin-type N-terminal cleavage/methylation domain-containing protein
MKKVSRAFTLIETLVTIAVTSIILGAIVVAIISIYKANSAAFLEAQYVDSARRAVETFVNDVREIDYAVTGAYPLEIVEAHRFGFYADIDPDNQTEYIEYTLSSSTLERVVYTATGTPPLYSATSSQRTILAVNLNNESEGLSTFTYKDHTGALVVDPSVSIATIRSAQLQLSINVVSATTTNNFLLQGSATLRNLRDRI